TALAEVMMRMSRPRGSLWAPAACTGLAILALSTRSLLQPATVSFFFLGLTLYLLNRPRQLRSLDSRAPFRAISYWLLVPLFVVWVNFDSWFLLGPITVGLYLLGEFLQQTFAPIRTGDDAPHPAELRTLTLVLVSGVAACLLNPHFYHAFGLPPE